MSPVGDIKPRAGIDLGLYFTVVHAVILIQVAGLVYCSSHLLWEKHPLPLAWATWAIGIAGGNNVIYRLLDESRLCK